MPWYTVNVTVSQPMWFSCEADSPEEAIQCATEVGTRHFDTDTSNQRLETIDSVTVEDDAGLEHDVTPAETSVT